MNMIQTMQKLPTMKTQLLFDLESTGLLRQGSRIHCLVTRNDEGDTQVYDHRPECAVIQGVKALEQADVLIGHNIIGYDIPLLKEQFPDFDSIKDNVLIRLSLAVSFILILLIEIMSVAQSGMPQRLYGRHSLEAWGYRLKCFKGDFGKHDGNWAVYTPEMLDYCIQDTEVTLKLWQLMQRRMNDYA